MCDCGAVFKNYGVGDKDGLHNKLINLKDKGQRSFRMPTPEMDPLDSGSFTLE